MTLGGLKEYARAEGVLVELRVASKLTADLSHKKRGARSGGVLQESSV
jgi:hypothetical protein